MTRMKQGGIDLVIPWVDGNDSAWRMQRDEYAECAGVRIRDSLYRDWGLLRYWFRGVEQNLPWIRKVHFITYGHLPAWLNTDHPKLNIVRHIDYMPKEYLPTFSSIPIETNVHRIKELSEYFITANDDTYFIGPVTPKEYFQDGLPCDCLSIVPITELCTDSFGHILWNNIACINRHFDMQDCAKKHEEKWFCAQYTQEIVQRNKAMLSWKSFPGLGKNHYPNAVLKSVYEEVWKKEHKLLNNTSEHRFRDEKDVSNWLMRYWQLASGRFVPYMQEGRASVCVGDEPRRIKEVILNTNNRIICINEGQDEVDFESRARYIRELFEMRLPEMSSYEKF